MEDLRRLVSVRQDDRVAGFLQLIDRLEVGRHERPLDRRDHLLDPVIEMRGGALHFGRPLQRWPRQRAGALGGADAVARLRGGMAWNGVSEIVGTVDSSDRHGSLPWRNPYTQYEHI